MHRLTIPMDDRELWNTTSLMKPPVVQWGAVEHFEDYSLTPLYYEGESYQGKVTKVFAYYALPKSIVSPVPSITLLHGGAGKAFPQWAGEWASRGYAAIAMDLFGNGPDGKRMDNGGPPESDESLFMKISPESLKDHWFYHAVAAAIRAVTIARMRKEIDPSKIGIMGISWGGYIADIVSGLDPRLAYAMTAYSAGYLQEGSLWTDRMSRMTDDQLELWKKYFESGTYIGRSTIPMFRATGTNDPCFYLESWRKSRVRAYGKTTVRLMKDWEHNYMVPWQTQEFFHYADSITNHGTPLPEVVRIERLGDRIVMSYKEGASVHSAELIYTMDTRPSPEREWITADAEIDPVSRIIHGVIPNSAYLCFFTLRDGSGNVVSTELMNR